MRTKSSLIQTFKSNLDLVQSGQLFDSIKREQSAKKMEEKHNKKRNKRTLEFALVSVLIPRIDRGSSGLPRLPGVIGRVSREFYEVVCEYGILNDCLRACDLEMYHGPISFDYETIKNKISLREAAKKTNRRTKNDLKNV